MSYMLVDAVASAFRAMQSKMFRPAVSIQRPNLRVEATRTDKEQERAATEDGEPASSSEEDDEDEDKEVEEDREDANNSAEDEGEDDENELEEDGVDAGPSRRRRLKKRKSHLSKTVEYEEGEVTDEEHDSSNRLRNLEARRASTRQADDDPPYDFDRLSEV